MDWLHGILWLPLAWLTEKIRKGLFKICDVAWFLVRKPKARLYAESLLLIVFLTVLAEAAKNGKMKGKDRAAFDSLVKRWKARLDRRAVQLGLSSLSSPPRPSLPTPTP